MCPHDWEKVILGNLNNNKLLDIWFSKKSVKIRQMLNNLIGILNPVMFVMLRVH